MPTSSKGARHSIWWRVLGRARERWVEVDGDQRAAALTFFILLSILPLIFVLVTLGSLFVDREVASHRVVMLVSRFAPLTSAQEGVAMSTVHDLLEARGKANLVAFTLLVWGALKALRSLTRTTNRVWRSPLYTWWQLPLRSLGLLGVVAVAALAGILLPAAARLIRQELLTHLDIPNGTFALLFTISPWLVLGCGILMTFKLAPSRPTAFSEVWMAALATTILIGVGEQLFLSYTVHFARFNVLYGTLGGVVAFLFWLYLSSCTCVFGVCACAALAEVREEARIAKAAALPTRDSAGPDDDNCLAYASAAPVTVPRDQDVREQDG